MINKNELAVDIYNVIKEYKKCYCKEEEIINQRKKKIQNKEQIVFNDPSEIVVHPLTDDWFLEDNLFRLIKNNKKDSVKHIENILSDKKNLKILQSTFDNAYYIMKPLAKVSDTLLFFQDKVSKEVCQTVIKQKYDDKYNEYYNLYNMLTKVEDKLFSYYKENFG